MKVPFTTRLDELLRQRLRIHAALTGRKVEDVVGAALDGYLPPAPEMAGGGHGPREELLAEQPGVA